jgi:primosomal protein N''
MSLNASNETTDLEGLNEEFRPEHHKARMARILATPVPSGHQFEARLREFLAKKEKGLDSVKDALERSRLESDIAAIKWALLPSFAKDARR